MKALRPGLVSLWLISLMFAITGSPGATAAPAIPVASNTAAPAAAGGEWSVVTVDLPVLFTFHPAMRNFDYRSRKFISQVPYKPPTGGMKAWTDLAAERARLADLEKTMAGQLGKVNAEMAANNKAAAESRDEPPIPSYTEYQKYAEMAQDHRQMLMELAHQVVGGFPDSLLGNLPSSDLQRVANDVFEAVEEEARKQNAAVVLNLPALDLGVHPAQAAPPPPPGTEPDLLDRLNIKTLFDLECLAQQASGSSPVPLGKAAPPKKVEGYCGGHFESVKDPEFLRTLVAEYYDNRNAFCGPFENLGVRRRILKGALAFHEKDITTDALTRIFDKYKTRKLEREAVFDILRRRRGGQ
ncbi:MAG: hypothetical protein GX442_11495 [Candidatus Riflebacteria bacterium]|nr:hypothetical protein [Candidatus Riflebacteria bacterium]